MNKHGIVSFRSFAIIVHTQFDCYSLQLVNWGFFVFVIHSYKLRSTSAPKPPDVDVQLDNYAKTNI